MEHDCNMDITALPKEGTDLPKKGATDGAGDGDGAIRNNPNAATDAGPCATALLLPLLAALLAGVFI